MKPVQSSRIFWNFVRYITLLPCIYCICAFAPGTVSGQDELSVLNRWKEYENASNALYHEIADEAYRYLDKRERTLTHINTPEKYRNYVELIKRKLGSAFGPLPPKSPLNVRITGTIEHEGIHVEKIIYESRPGFWVTGCVFKAIKSEGRLPAILYVCGHTQNGFRSEAYQRVILNLARKGFLVFAIDPVGQGERFQYVNEENGSSLVGGPTKEHSYAGLQYLLLGRTMAMVRLWDGIRAIDYLTERPDVDPDRIGVQGRSGGGTMSSYLGAMDSRIAAAAPECYITSFRRLLQSIGPQDAEQNLLEQISSGLDHGDFLIARENRPTLVVTTTRDFFSIQGARETVHSINSQKAFQSEMNLSMVEDDAPHQSTQKNREAVYEFFMKAFNIQGQVTDEEVPIIDEEVLRVTPTGQTETSGSKTIHDLIKEDAHELIENLENNRKKSPDYAERIINSARQLSGFKDITGMIEPIFCGRIDRGGYSIEKYIICTEESIPLPALFFVPESDKPYHVILYINPAGKQAVAAPGGEIETLVRRGYCVLAPDIPGYGELSVDTQGGDSVIGGVSYNILFGAQLIGRSITGIQAAYIVSACRFLKARDDVLSESITGIAKGVAGPALLHAAVLDRNITSVALLQSPVSWVSVINERFYDHSIGSTIVPSALTSYDLIDLLCVMAPRKLLIFEPVGGDADVMRTGQMSCLNTVRDVFYTGKEDRYKLVTKEGHSSLSDALSEWLSY